MRSSPTEVKVWVGCTSQKSTRPKEARIECLQLLPYLSFWLWYTFLGLIYVGIFFFRLRFGWWYNYIGLYSDYVNTYSIVGIALHLVYIT